MHNLPDGRVETAACGEQQNVEQFEQWLMHGPEHASVTQVETTIIEVDSDFDSFEIREC